MAQVLTLTDPRELASLRGQGAIPNLTVDQFKLHAPTHHLILLNNVKTPIARCSIWTKSGLILADQRVGIIGHYATGSVTEGVELLQHACQVLVQMGCDRVVGPMDGSTWFGYRLITEWGDQPPFFLEPNHPSDWPNHFDAAGFNPLTHYCSALVEPIDTVDPRMERVTARMQALGVQISSLKTDQFEDLLLELHPFCLKTFAQNFLYTPIDQERFLALYHPIKPYIQPDLIRVARHQDQIVGFAFALPDLAQAQRGQTIDTLVIKTVAVDPNRAYAGLGSLLAQQCQQMAQQLGMRRSIHALMHEQNVSRHALGRIARPFRRYTLFDWNPGYSACEHRSALD